MAIPAIIRLSMTESELALAEQKVNDYNAVINRMKQDMTELAVSHQNDIKQEKEVCTLVVFCFFVLCTM